jgi:uncharacterized protein (TIGR03435 family)
MQRIRNRVVTALFLLLAISHAQSPSPLQFEVASIRASGPLIGEGDAFPKGMGIPADGTVAGGPGSSDPERITYTRVVMLRILREAFGLDADQILGPNWLYELDDPLHSQRYDIAAKVAPGTTRQEASLMMQNLLKERMGLTYHYEKKEFTVYVLGVAKGGPKLIRAFEGARGQSSSGPGTISPTRGDDGFPRLPPGVPGFAGKAGDGLMRMTGQVQTIENIGKILVRYLNVRHVVDRTGLAGTYNFTLEFSAEGLPVTFAGGVPSGPSDDLFTAVQRQMGLKLERSKTLLDVLVVDHLNRLPVDN